MAMDLLLFGVGMLFALGGILTPVGWGVALGLALMLGAFLNLMWRAHDAGAV